jgi:rod shape-determining protein MreD
LRISIKIIANFFLLLALQVLVLNYVNLGGYINPYIYVFPILILPLSFPGWAMLLLAFLLGLIVDFFMDTMGIHAAATVLMAFSRPGIIRLISTREKYDEGTIPQFSNMGRHWVILYTIILVGIHHLCLFSLEVFRLMYFHVTLGVSLLNTIVSSALILFILFVFDSSSRR